MNKKNLFTMAASAVILLCLPVTSDGQKFWDKKEYLRWSDFETVEILINSPWGKTVRDDAIRRSVNIRLHSGLTLRQALLRRRQINMKYDTLSAADQEKFDAKVRDALECADCVQNYIVTMRFLPLDKTVIQVLNRLSLEELKPYVFLENDKGDQRSLAAFRYANADSGDLVNSENAMFYFARLDAQGKPLISSANKKLYFLIDDKAFGERVMSIGRVSFDVSKLSRGGKVDF